MAVDNSKFNVTSQNARRTGQGANLAYNAENERIETAVEPFFDTAVIPSEDAENKRIEADGTPNEVPTDPEV